MKKPIYVNKHDILQNCFLSNLKEKLTKKKPEKNNKSLMIQNRHHH